MDKNFFKKPFLATGVGSLPHLDARRACDFIEDKFSKEIIYWPQLVKRSFNENMYVQFSQGIPGITVEPQAKKIYIDTQSDNLLKEMEASYLHALNNDVEYFAIPPEYAAGFYEILSRGKLLNSLEYFKGQVIGPISFGLTITDQDGQAVIYNSDLSEILVKVLAMKARWQIKKIKNQNPNLKILIFVDEPYLVSVGTSFVSLKKERIVNDINEIINAIHSEGALAGVHCCGNTDWSMILETKLDILSFDAYNYLDNLLLYPAALEKFLNGGGRLAWGIVPNDKESLESLNSDKLAEIIAKTAKEKDIPENNCLITPSCGCGTLSESLAEQVHLLAIEVANKLS